jgi:D-serine dehydratase
MNRPKGFPLAPGPDTGWNLFDADVAFPAAVLLDSALTHNGAMMREYCERHGVSLAPHGKTTMAPALFRRQIADGAWAITAATTWQAKTMRETGLDRVLIANQVVVPAEIEWLAEATSDGFEVYCYVDSVVGVEIMNETLATVAREVTLPVLLEVGVAGGRTGVRSRDAGLDVARAVAAAPQLALTGTAGFEGIITGNDHQTAAELVDGFLDRIVEMTHAVAEGGWFEPSPEVIITAGGSTYFDHVVERFSSVRVDFPCRIVIRSGCYITHDDGAYDRSSPMGAQARASGDAHFVPAIEIWGVVLSRPEPERALVGIGKRDASADGLLPLAKKVRGRGSDRVEAIEPIRLHALNDQHAYLDLDPAASLSVGDLVGFGISHPCTTFDKWRSMALVDDDYNVIEMVETLF